MDTTELNIKYENEKHDMFNKLYLATFVLFVMLILAVVYDLTISHTHKILFCAAILLCYVSGTSYLRKQHKKVKDIRTKSQRKWKQSM